MEGKKVRLGRTTRAQYEELIAFIENYPLIVRGKNKPSEAHTTQELWEKFATNLASKNMGPYKTADQWKRVLTEWKVNTRRKSREIMVAQQGTGGGPATKKKLTDLEERLLEVFSNIHLGDQSLPDNLGGMSEEINQSNAEIQLHEEVSVVAVVLPEEALNVPPHPIDGSVNGNHEINIIEDVKNYYTNEEAYGSSMIFKVKPQEQQGAKKRKGTDLEETVLIFGDTDTPTGKRKKVTESRYTSSYIQEACGKFAEAQAASLQASTMQADAIKDLSSAIRDIGETIKKKNEILQEIAQAKLMNAEANVIRAKAEEMNTRIKFMKLMAHLENTQ